jgi:hypothetical protein
MDRSRVLVLLALAAGSSRKAAAGKAGITYRTLCRWQEQEEFADAVEVATGQGRALYEEILRQAAEKDWRAALALYESIYLDQSKGRRSNADDLDRTLTPDPVLAGITDEQAAERIAQVLTILRESLGSEEAVQEVVEANVRRLRLVQG